CGAPLIAYRPCSFRRTFSDALLRLKGAELEHLRRCKPFPNDWMRAVFLVEFERLPAARSTGSGQRQHPARGRPHPENFPRSEVLARACDSLEQTLERRNEMRFIENEQGVVPQESGHERSDSPRRSISLKQQTRSDHIDRPDDNRRP